ncbi:uncharacterized protein LOC126998917 [Eriocheir sinensis]|uniref:uncharacterized protein LOC126998917 n=1 Tax=Eriocheir sinensis TaxID=95602 RepID=UPI0021C6CF0A|nr:uncharacterized protein LOC126998917 [Eriocheir sinensis]XP_050717127.1 uncharacterized protein LOC126998917 [Eriocheir sinensis]XP_050717128.1 uncharacterized protein LOC126998917 [Eriocheir sinensis]
MSIKLEDMLTVVKPPPQALDLFRTKIKCKEDFDKAYEKVPEYKIRPEKVRPGDVMGEGPGGWRTSQGRGSEEPPQATYADPLPPSMRGLNMDEFYEVDIDWRMLTTARPKNRCEEEIFSRYVEMGRLQLQRLREEAEKVAEGKEWTGRIVKVVPGKGSLPETRLPTCRECGEELCEGMCKDYLYMNYQRVQTEEKKEEEESGLDVDDIEGTKQKGKKKKKTKKRKKKKKKEADQADGDADDEEE